MAWTGNFKDQIDNLAGTLAVTDDAAIQQWITDGCYDVTQKAIAKNGEAEIWKFAVKSGDQTTNGFDVDEIRTIASVLLNDVFATKGQWSLKSKYADPNSIHAPTSNTPVWILDNNQVYTFPAPTGPAPANYYYIPEYTAAGTWNTGTSAIVGFPSEYYYHVMLYAAIQVLHRRMLDSTVSTSPTFDALPVTPDIVLLDNIVYVSPSEANVTTPTVATTAYVVPTTVLAAFDISGITIPVASITEPNIISPGVTETPKSDISGDVPLYNGDNTIIDFGIGAGQQFAALATKTITDLSINAVGPDTPVLQEVTYAPVDVISIGSVVDMAITDITLGDATAATSASHYTSSQAGSSQPNFVKPEVPGVGDDISDILPLSTPDTIDVATDAEEVQQWWSVVTHLIEDEEDIELANATLSKISTYVSAYQAAVQVSLNEYNEDATIYQALIQESSQNIQQQNQNALQNMQKDQQMVQTNLQKSQQILQANLQKDTQIQQTKHATALQREQIISQNAQAKAMQDAVQTTQAIIAENNVKIQKYQAELSVYSAEVNTEVQEYTQNSQKEMQLWQNHQTQIMQQHSQSMQDTLNVFNAANARYQANIQAEMQYATNLAAKYQKESDTTLQASMQDYTLELQELSYEVSRYQANVQSVVQDYQQSLSRYQAEQQDSQQTAAIANQANLQQGQTDLQVAIRNGDKEMERLMTIATNDMQSIVQNNQQKMTKYQTELTQYQADLAVYQADASNKLQKYQSDLQAEGVSYQWLQDQYNRLKMDYERAFASAEAPQ